MRVSYIFDPQQSNAYIALSHPGNQSYAAIVELLTDPMFSFEQISK